VRAVAQAILSASLHDSRENQRAWSCGCRAAAKSAKAITVGEATAMCNRPVHRGTEDGTYEQTRRLNWGPSLFPPARVGGLGSKCISCRAEERGADEVIVSDDPEGQHNPPASQGPLDGIGLGTFRLSFPSRGGLVRKDHYRRKTNTPLAVYKSICSADRRRSRLNSRLKPYWGKPTVRNFRGGGENTGTRSASGQALNGHWHNPTSAVCCASPLYSVSLVVDPRRNERLAPA
jgi:hypothetical protein